MTGQPWWHQPADDPSDGDGSEGSGSGAGAAPDPAQAAAALLGTVMTEAGRFLSTVQGRMSLPGESLPIATGSQECLACPVCRAIAALRAVDPDDVDRFAAGLTALLDGLTPRATDTDADGAAGAPPGAGAEGEAPAGREAGPRRTGPHRPRRPTRPRTHVEHVPLDEDGPLAGDDAHDEPPDEPEP